MKRILPFLIAAFVLVALASCSAHKPIRSVLYPADDGIARIVPLKSRLAVALDNPNLPLRKWTTVSVDGSILRMDGRRTAGQYNQIEGDPYRTVMFFETIGEGETVLELAYCDPRDCENTTELTYKAKIKVVKKKEMPEQ